MIRQGMNLLDAVRRAAQLGCQVYPLRKTGELRFAHPSMPVAIKTNARRKDAARHVVRFLRRIEKKENENG